MKRTLCEVAAAGAVLFVLVGVHAEIDGLRRSDQQRTADIARIETSLHGEVTEEPKSRDDVAGEVRHQAERLHQLHDSYNEVLLQIAKLERNLEEGTRSASRNASDAILKSAELGKSVEATQKQILAAKQDLETQRQEIERRLQEYRGLLSSMQSEIRPQPDAMTSTMLRPTIQLTGEETVGSGIIVACNPREDAKGYDTYVLTAYHVVRNILADDPAIEKRGITVTMFGDSAKTNRACDVIAKSPKLDLALCKLRGTERVDTVARMIAPDAIADIKIWHPVFAVGCPLGNDPIPTGGFVSSLASEVRGTSYWMVNAPTYYGNSGGGIYCGERRELVAVFSKIYTHGSGRPVVIPHMGLCVPMTLVYPWLRDEGFGFLIPPSSSDVAKAANETTGVRTPTTPAR
ncbi:MAG: trypsin-like peptidase domain-containing protein [Planctomycetes bacterium]|nr:trypsin-like peptidase domain-containing protein [Planctomycetota bacterium]MCB9919429.1 trypsin-like peptidase domain-containing protein [Planctomycetota bacterium]